ncbi:MAG: hypothetical protein II319_02625, partial [Clostridia bacterium]|nr:hypothetical protein [Clostridia bacterium]
MKLKTIKRALFLIALIVLAISMIGCGEDHEHTYNRKDTSFTYLESEANCENSAVYYYSCSCGEKGTETFVYGKPSDHEFASNWTFDADAHWHGTNCGHDAKSDVSA